MSRKVSDILTRNEQRAVTEFLRRLQQELTSNISDVILFGSKARGDARSDSDIDILLVIDTDDWRVKHTISTISADIGLEYDVFIDPRVMSAERWAYLRRNQFTLYTNVSREGIPLTPAA